MFLKDSVQHIASGCTQLAKRVAMMPLKDNPQNTLKSMEEYSLECTGKWYEHSPPLLEKNALWKLMWDTILLTNKRLEINRPDITRAQKRS